MQKTELKKTDARADLHPDARQGSLQDLFLNRARRTKMPLTVFLVNGFQLRGIVLGFDPYTVVLDSDGKQQMIYKHAISTLAPVRPIPLRPEDGEAE